VTDPAAPGRAVLADPRVVLQIQNLRTYFYARGRRAFIRSVDGVTLSIHRGETLGLVGESGSGKSMTALSVMGLVAGSPGVITGAVNFAGRLGNERPRNLLQDVERYVRLTERDGRIMAVAKDERGWRAQVERLTRGVRGREIAMIFQNPKGSLNPFVTVGRQIMEAVLLHTPVKDRLQAKERAISWLERVRMDSPRLRFDHYPDNLSGGMCQRAMIAMALASEPALLIADEPTTGLDATIQSRIVGLLAELKSTLGVTTLLISHDIRVVSRLANAVAVMYGGTVMEHGPADDVLAPDFTPKHPYTAGLLASLPSAQHEGRLHAIDGDVVDTMSVPRGCRFYDRCSRITDAIRRRCAEDEPALTTVASGHRVRCWLYAEEPAEGAEAVAHDGGRAG
jgi:peptide/nickel transport system ATP-binding protein